MITILVKESFDERNLTNAININLLIDKISKSIDFQNEINISLDLTGCITDYPETPRLIDYFLQILAKQHGEKTLNIIYTGIGTNELHVLYDIVIENRFFDITKETTKTNSDWIQIIHDKLKGKGIILTVSCPVDNKNYTYGK